MSNISSRNKPVLDGTLTLTRVIHSDSNTSSFWHRFHREIQNEIQGVITIYRIQGDSQTCSLSISNITDIITTAVDPGAL